MNAKTKQSLEPPVLHFLNGESTAQTLRQTSIPGELFSFADVLIDGPAPAGLNQEAWRAVRVRHLSDAYGVDPAEAQRGLLRQEQALASYFDHEEVVLWFDQDLFCQVNLLYLLDWFSQRELGRTRLSLICTDEYVGTLSPERLASLFEARAEMATATLRLAARAWEVYCSEDPTAIETLLASDTSALPYLRAAFISHLARFPSVRNGLGRIENQGLDLIAGGANDFARLFLKFQSAEPMYGLGD